MTFFGKLGWPIAALLLLALLTGFFLEEQRITDLTNALHDECVKQDLVLRYNGTSEIYCGLPPLPGESQ